MNRRVWQPSEESVKSTRRPKVALLKMSINTCTATHSRTKGCALVLVCQYLKIKGRAAAVWLPQACFYSLHQVHTHLQGSTQTQSFHAGYTMSGVLLKPDGEEQNTRERVNESAEAQGCGWGV